MGYAPQSLFLLCLGIDWGFNGASPKLRHSGTRVSRARALHIVAPTSQASRAPAEGPATSEMCRHQAVGHRRRSGHWLWSAQFGGIRRLASWCLACRGRPSSSGHAVSIGHVPRPVPMQCGRPNPYRSRTAANAPSPAQQCLGFLPTRVQAYRAEPAHVTVAPSQLIIRLGSRTACPSATPICPESFRPNHVIEIV
jgi:hypothetical protein